MPAVLRGGVEATQVGAVSQPLVTRQNSILLDPPQQLRLSGQCLAPHLKAKESPISQAQHGAVQCAQHLFGQGVLARGIGAHAGAKQHVRAVLHQRDETKLRVGTAAPTCARAAKGLIVGLLVGHIHGAAVYAHQSPLSVPGTLGGWSRDGFDHFIMKLAQRLPPQAGARLRNPRITRHLEHQRRVYQPL